MFGLYGLVQGPMVLFSYYSSEMYRSLGLPRVSTFVQAVFMAIMIPTMIWAAANGFDYVVWADVGTRVILIVINQVVTFFVVGILFWQRLESLKEPLFATLVMGVFAYLTYELCATSWLLIALDIIGCALIYFAVCMVFPKSRELLFKLVRSGFKDSIKD